MKPEMFQDEKLAPLPPITRLVFLGLIAMADDAGRVLDNVRVVDSFVFPVTDDSCRDSLARLATLGRIRRGFTASGQPVIQIANWGRHQKVDHPNYKAALPELVDTPDDSDARENVASDSRERRDGLAHHTNDLRPTSGALETVARDSREAREASDRPDAWVDPFAVEWERRIGMASKPKLVLLLRPLIERHGVPQVYAAWQGYVREGEGQKWVSPRHFAETYQAVAERWALATDTAGHEFPIPDRPGCLAREVA